MSAVTQLGYVGIEASNLDEWQRFAVDLLGMQVGRRDEKTLTLRMDERVQRIIIEQGPADDLSYSGFECASEPALVALVAKLREAGLAVEAAGAELAAIRGVDHLFVTHDPDGNRVELYFGPAVTNVPFRSSAIRSSFVTAEQGLGHG